MWETKETKKIKINKISNTDDVLAKSVKKLGYGRNFPTYFFIDWNSKHWIIYSNSAHCCSTTDLADKYRSI